LIVVLDGTGIAEMGSHDELMERGGIFAGLHGAHSKFVSDSRIKKYEYT